MNRPTARSLALKGIALAGLVAGLGIFMSWMAGVFAPDLADRTVSYRELGDGDPIVPVRIERRIVYDQATGVVRPQEQTLVSSRITAQVADILVREGDAVTTGQLLIQLDRRDLQARLAQAAESVAGARAALTESTQEFERVQKLRAEQVVSQAAFDSAQARQSANQAALDRSLRAREEAEVALSFATLLSPLEGRVAARLADPGDVAAPGVPLLGLYSPDSLRLEANIRESLAFSLAPEAKLRARIDSTGTEFETIIDEIVPQVNSASRTVPVKVLLDGAAGYFPGMFGRLFIPVGEETVVLVPSESVGRVGQLTFVDVLADTGHERRMIRVADDQDLEAGWLRVVSGLREGEKLVVAPR